MRNTTLKIIVISLLLISNLSFGQTVYEHAQDGKLFFKIKNSEKAAHIKGYKGRKISIQDSDFINDISEQFNIEWVEKAFVIKNGSEDLNSIFRVSFSNPNQIDNLIKAFEQYSFIEYAEKVPFVKVLHSPNDPLYTNTNTYNWNWHLDVIHAEQAWDISTGSSSIKVAIVDGAIWAEHPDLANKILYQHSYVSPQTSSSPPSSASQSSSMEAYEWSHGTHCAGLVGAESNNNVGIASIGYNVSLMTYRAADDNGDLYYTSYGVEWAANNGAEVISMSYGGPTYSSSQNTFFNDLKNDGIVLLAASGNDGVSTESYPAAYTAVIAVGSVNEDLELSDFSNYGSWVDIAAPGGYATPSSDGINVLSSTYTEAFYYSSVYFLENTNYDGMQGTSMACPVTAGLCGLILSINPNLTPDEVKACLMNNAQTTTGNSIHANSGCIDAYASALCAQNGSSPNAQFTADQTTISVGGTVQFTDQSTGSPSSWSWNFGDGSTSTTQSPSHQYNTSGTYTVALTINGNEDTETKTGYITVNEIGNSFTLDFEASNDFSLTFDPWTVNDVDGLSTYGIQDVSFTHSGEAQAFIAFNNTQTDPAVANPAPHGGDRFGACFAAVPSGGLINDDWLISPQVQLNNNSNFKLWVKSHTDTYGLERYQIGVSTTNNAPGSFTIISSGTYEEAPLEWTEMTYDLSAYNNQQVYVGIHCVSSDAFVFMVDDISINTSATGVKDQLSHKINIYPNPNNGEFAISLNTVKATVKIYDVNGKLIINEIQNSTRKNYDLSNLQSGIYIVKIISNNEITTKRITIK